MTHTLGTLREFHTKNYRVLAEALEDYDVDLSFDDTGEILQKLESGELMSFTAHVEVIHKPTGLTLGEDYLGSCIYESLDAFMDHRECGKQNKVYEARGDRGRCGSYFHDMIREACGAARRKQTELNGIRLRKEQP